MIDPKPINGKALVCGHYATTQPIAVFPNKRKLYRCPKGCGLQKSKR